MKTWQKIAAALTALAAAALILFGIASSQSSLTQTGEKSYTVKVIHKDGSEKEFQFTTEEEYLRQALEEQELIEGSESSYGLYVDTVDQETASYETDGSYWMFMVGEDYSQTGVDTTPVEEGQVYTWIYTTE